MHDQDGMEASQVIAFVPMAPLACALMTTHQLWYEYRCRPRLDNYSGFDKTKGADMCRKSQAQRHADMYRHVRDAARPYSELRRSSVGGFV